MSDINGVDAMVSATCYYCNETYQTPESKARHRTCPKCIEEAQYQTLQRWIPPIYLDSNRSRLEADNRKLLACVDDFDIKSKRGLYVSGQPGTCKTRCASYLLSRYCYAGYSIAMVRSTQLAEAYALQFKDDKEGEKSRSLLKDIKKARALLIDDIGKEKMTERYETELWSLLEERTSNLKPTLYTSNFNLEQLHKRFSPDQSLAMVRRIMDFCKEFP
jgi:DNA replication protein DnaC